MSTYYYLGCKAHRTCVSLVTDKGNAMFDNFRSYIGGFVRAHVSCCGTDGHGTDCMLMEKTCSEGIEFLNENAVDDYEHIEEDEHP